MGEGGGSTVEEEGVVAHVVCFLSWLLVRGCCVRLGDGNYSQFEGGL